MRKESLVEDVLFVWSNTTKDILVFSFQKTYS